MDYNSFLIYIILFLIFSTVDNPPLPTKNLKMEKLLAVLLNKTHIDDDVIKSSE